MPKAEPTPAGETENGTVLRRVAVTGSTGFIGRHLVRCFLNAGLAVNALSRRDELPPPADNLRVVRGSLEDAGSLVSLIEDADAVVHAAGATHARSRSDFFAINGTATARLASLAAERSENCRFILLSSLAAREPAISDYAASKKAAEAALQATAGALRWTVLRPPAVYGGGDRATLPLFRAMKRGFLPVPGDGLGRFSLIEVRDLAEAILTLVSGPLADGQVLEIRDAQASGYSWLDALAAGSSAAGRSVRPIHLPETLMRLTAGASSTICRLAGFSPMITTGKIREFYHRDWVCPENPVAVQTSWHPTIGLEDGFRSAYEWYTENSWI